MCWEILDKTLKENPYKLFSSQELLGELGVNRTTLFKNLKTMDKAGDLIRVNIDGRVLYTCKMK